MTTAEDRESSPLREASPVRVITQKDFAKIVDRLYQTQKSYNERRERKVKERDAAEMENVQAKPVINRKSAELTSTMVPLTARQTKLLEERAEVQKKAQAQAKAAELAKIHGPHLCPRSHDIKRTVDDLLTWNDAKLAKRKELQAKKSQAEVYSFQPQVNSKSTKIFKQFRQTDEAHWDRLLRESDEKKAKRKLENELGGDGRESKFYPEISQRARRVKREGSIYDRLYESSRHKRFGYPTDDVHVEAAARTGARTSSPDASRYSRPDSPSLRLRFNPAPRAQESGGKVNVVTYDPMFDHIFNHVRSVP
jgi:hypothetical protein